MEGGQDYSLKECNVPLVAPQRKMLQQALPFNDPQLGSQLLRDLAHSSLRAFSLTIDNEVRFSKPL